MLPNTRLASVHRLCTSQTHRGMSSRPHYPRPVKPVSTVPLVPPPPRLPYRAPPGPPPALPDRPDLSPPPGWTRTSHAVPAAFPRRFGSSFGTLSRESRPQTTNPPKEGESKEERLARNEGEAREILISRYDAKRSEGDEEKGLWMAAERWVRTDKDMREGVTLVITHANGFHKEVCMGRVHGRV